MKQIEYCINHLDIMLYKSKDKYYFEAWGIASPIFQNNIAVIIKIIFI